MRFNAPAGADSRLRPPELSFPYNGYVTTRRRFMGLAPGTLIGPYRIVSTLGSGGMGEVYRARDPRLQRDVAIKSLPETVAADAEHVARFQREAHVLASLNHPHIAALYGLEETGDTRYLVLELIEGHTLAQLLESGPLPIGAALALGRQIANALGAAHDKGIVHRDLKPANIAVTPEKHVKVLDFGLAKTLAPPSSHAAADPTTITSAGTQLGLVLGTAAYMSPEQARGLPVDKRTDIWAFGCVLYEMIAGRRAFAGNTTSDAIARILEREPDWRLLPPSTPPRVRWLLQRCLAKEPSQRLHDIADARIELDEALSRPAADTEPAGPAAAWRTREKIAWATAAICLLGLVTTVVLKRGGGPDSPGQDVQSYNASIVLPSGMQLSGDSPPGRFALSPDGRRLAVATANAAGQPMLYVRNLDGRVLQPLGGTEGAAYPFWSADSKYIAFLAQRKLKKVAAAGGDVVVLGDASLFATGAWNRDGVILFTPTGNSPLFRVSATSGPPVAATTLDVASGDVQHSFPCFLPDGRHFLYFVVGSKAGRTVPRGVYVGSLDASGPGKLILEGATNARYANGHLVFLRAGSLLAQPFDLDRLETRGPPVPLVEQVQGTGPSASDPTGAFSLSDTGVLAYQTLSQISSQLTWFSREGKPLSTLGDRGNYVDVALSPDGSRVATSFLDPAVGTRDIWTFDISRGLGQRVTFEPSDDFGPNWSRPAGDRIFFSSQRMGTIHLYEKAASGSGSESLVLDDELGKFNPRPSADGRYLIYVAGGGIIGRSDIWFLPLFGGRKAAPFIETAFIESQPQFSPDGRWVAFMSDKSGSREVYVTAFPAHGEDIRISTAGGTLPRWGRTGGELFYIAPDGRLTVVPVDGRGARFQPGAPQPLFAIRSLPIRLARLDSYPYDVAADGKRILVNTFLEELTPPITLLVNWPPRQ